MYRQRMSGSLLYLGDDMKKSDLHREYARVIDMCEGTDVKPKNCWIHLGRIQNVEPEFSATPDYYSFALAIVEGRPVFEGDKLYDHEGSGFTVSSAGIKNDYQSRCTWNPPRKTITVTIPRPSDYGFSMSRLTLYFKDSLAQAEADNVFKEAMK